MVSDSSTRNSSCGERSTRASASHCTLRGQAMASNSFLPCNRRHVALMVCVTSLLSMASVQQTRAFMLTPINSAAADAALPRSRESTLRRARAQDRYFPPGSAAKNSRRGQNVCRGWGKRATTGTRVGVTAVADSKIANSKEVIEDNTGYTVDAVVGKCNLEPLPPLKNRYYALRHGQSVANMWVLLLVQAVLCCICALPVCSVLASCDVLSHVRLSPKTHKRSTMHTVHTVDSNVLMMEYHADSSSTCMTVCVDFPLIAWAFPTHWRAQKSGVTRHSS